jgi:hypothetical protein
MRVPLVYKPGIQRNAGDFQDEYCIDGQWIRFVNGKIRKMKGQKEIYWPNGVEPTFLDIYFNGTNPVMLYTTINNVNRCIMNNELSAVTNDRQVLDGLGGDTTRTWQSARFIMNGIPHIALLSTFNGNNMLSNQNGVLFWKSMLDDNADFVSYEDGLIPGNDEEVVSGGILYSSPCLYLYGNNGTILRSKTSNPLNFDDTAEDSDADSIKISENKLLFGASIRGGTNAPTFLFWTQNSVIYLTNIADGTNPRNPIEFQREEITTNSSVMSPKSIVQYDSLFFWLGTDRAFVYNGIVESIKNDVNFEWFLENVDLNKRQLIYGYKVARYGEIRWAFPEKRYRNNPDIGCTREIVYNVRENSWYDTTIERSCVAIYESTGDIFSFGNTCTKYPRGNVGDYKSIWKQETGYYEVRRDNSVHNIPSFFTTPYFGYAAFPPAKDGKVMDKYIRITEIEPDFPAPEFHTRVADELLVVGAAMLKYAGVPKQTIVPVNFDLYIGNNRGKIDMRVQGRFVNITFACVHPYTVGNILINFEIGDGQ